MKQQNRLSTEQKAETQVQALHQQQTTTTEFGSVEELLRHDALHTPVPPTVASRLQESINREPPATRSWWRRLFGG